MTYTQGNRGRLVAVRGSVIDVRFPDHLPVLHRQLKTESDPATIIEVTGHLDRNTVRGLALTPTRGLARATRVLDTGEPLLAPVGDRVLGRVFNLFAQTIDDGEPLHDGEWRPIRREPVPIARQATSSEILANHRIDPQHRR